MIKEILMSCGVSVTTAFAMIISTIRLISNNKSLLKKIQNSAEIKALKDNAKNNAEQIKTLIEENASLRRSVNQLTDAVRGIDRGRKYYENKNKEFKK